MKQLKKGIIINLKKIKECFYDNEKDDNRQIFESKSISISKTNEIDDSLSNISLSSCNSEVLKGNQNKRKFKYPISNFENFFLILLKLEKKLVVHIIIN